MANFADLWEQTPVDKMAGLKSDFAARVQAANDAWQAKTGNPLPITSGYRTTQEQSNLYANKSSNPNLVAKPGTSQHEYGNAADISPNVPNAAVPNRLQVASENLISGAEKSLSQI